MQRSLAGASAVSALLVCSATDSWAQDCPPSSDESREREAQELNLSGQHSAALERFVELQHRCPTPRTLARLALTEAALGRWVAADLHLREALTAEDPWIFARRRDLDAEAARIASHLGQLLVAGEGPPGSVYIDGQRVADWPMVNALRVPVGAVRVRVVAEGCAPVERVVPVQPGILSREEVTPYQATPASAAPAVVPTDPPPPPPRVTAPTVVARQSPRRAGPWPVVGWSVLGASLVALGVGTALLVSRDEALGSLRAEGCHGVMPPVDRCDAVANRADEHGLGAAVGLAVGGSLLAVSAGAFVAAALRGEPSRASWFCAPASGGLTAVCTWRF